MAGDLSRTDIKEEENLLVEAVSLLVQRQREAESWVAEQIWQAEERAATTERRYTDLEARLGAIEDQLNRLTREVEPARVDAVVDERLARLREQVAGLKSDPDGRPAVIEPRPVVHQPDPPPVRPVTTVASREPEPVRVAAAPPPPAHAATPANPGVLELLGSTPADRWGVVLIGLGAIAVLYALLTQLRFG